MNGIKLDIIKRKIIINKTFATRMSNTSSAEYLEYERLVSLNPSFEIKITTQKTYDREKYKGLTYKFIEAYIYCHELDKESRNKVFSEYIEERWKALAHNCGYKEVRAWFINRYPEFDNLYFEKHEKPATSKIAEWVDQIANFEKSKLDASTETPLLTA